MDAQTETPASLAGAVVYVEALLDPAAVILFGSRGSGRFSEGSDFDIAVLVARDLPDLESISRLRTELEERLRHNVDLLVLDTASPIIAMQVLRHGRLLSCLRPQDLETFTVRTLTDYADLKITRRPIEERLLRPSDG